VNLDQQFERFHDHWHPKTVATVNDDEVKLVKVQGEFVWPSIRTPTSCFWSSTASCASSSTVTPSSDPASCWWCRVGCATVRPADQETRVLFLALRDAVDTGDADRVGTVGSGSPDRSVRTLAGCQPKHRND
jgi:hypothetical protein